MSDVLEKIDHRGLTIEIHHDPHGSESPREWDNGTKLVLAHRRYDLPNEINLDFDDFDGWDEVEAHIRETYKVVGFKWVIGYDHGQLILRAQDGRRLPDPWDSGVAGFIFMDEDGQAEMGTPPEYVDEVLVGDVKTYNDWATGNIHAYVVLDDKGETVDSCGGFVGDDDHCISEAKAAADFHADARDSEEAAAMIPVQVTE